MCDPEQCLLLRPQVDIRQEQCTPLPDPPAPRAEDKGPRRESGAGVLGAQQGGGWRKLSQAGDPRAGSTDMRRPKVPSCRPMTRWAGWGYIRREVWMPAHRGPGRAPLAAVCVSQGLRQEHFSLSLLNFHQKPCLFLDPLGPNC